MGPPTADQRRRSLLGVQAALIVQSVELTHLLAHGLGSDTTTNTAIRVLLTVHETTGVAPSSLARRLGLSRSAVSRALRDLQTGGLVARAPDPRDRRVRRLTLTAAGAQRISAFEQQVVEHFSATTAGVLERFVASGERVPSPAGQPPTPLEAIDALAVAGTAANRDQASAAGPFGITNRSDRFAISLIGHHGGLRPTDLASTLRLTSGGVSQLIDRLEAARLVTRDLGVRDRRAVIVTLTERGERATGAILDALEPHTAALCTAFAIASRAAPAPSAASA